MPANKKILIVEDEISLAKPLIEKFKSKGFAVSHGSNGEEGLALALKEQPDFIMLDLMMPKMDGTAMLKALRADPKGQKMNVMIMSNVNDPSVAGATAGLGVVDYVVKSDWKIKDIVDRVSKRIGG